MEQELAPREKPLPYKVKAMSRESPSQKATHVLDPDLRTHWSTGTNTKEWILLELDEPCLLSHLRIYNKSVLEWEISVGLRYKPETFVKVRPRCEAPRRDMTYPMNYTPCRYVRISCLRGNPIAVFFIQLIGVSVTGLEPEFQPVVNYLLPQIVSHRQDAHDMHLQLLQDVTDRLLIFLPQLEMDLVNFSELPESNMRFFAMLVGPFYPVLRIVNEREMEKTSLILSDSDALRSKLNSSLTVSSNFEAQPRRSRSPSALLQSSPNYLAFRPEYVFMLLRKAYKDTCLGIICRTASRALQRLTLPATVLEDASAAGDPADVMCSDDDSKALTIYHSEIRDYSALFGDDFKGHEDQWDVSCINLLDLASVEEGILHVLFACASQYSLCCKLADNISDFWSVLPLIQALLPALRPLDGSPAVPRLPDQIDDNFSHWRHPFTQRALHQITIMVSLSEFRPLLHAAAAYLSSFLPLHAKAACVLIDLCAGPLACWIPTVIAKVDLATELLEDLLGIIQHARHSLSRARACLKYILLALSGHMDEILAKYKEVKYKLLFLVEMLEPFLDPAISATKGTIAFGEVSTMFLEKQEQECAIALNIIRAAVRRPAVLPSLESEWRRGSVAPSVLLSILGPHMPLPTEIDTCKYPLSTVAERDESEEKHDLLEANINNDIHEDVSMLFAPSELKNIVLDTSSTFKKHCHGKSSPESSNFAQERFLNEKSANEIRSNFMFAVPPMDYFNFQADYLQLVDLNDCKRRASDFQRLAVDLHSQQMVTPEGHEAAIDALLLAAECYINPFFMISFRRSSRLLSELNTFASKKYEKDSIMLLGNDFKQTTRSLEAVEHLEKKRDQIVLEILLQAAVLDRDYYEKNIQQSLDSFRTSECSVKISSIDLQSADAVTLVRQNQALLCHFLTQRLLKEQNSSHEVLLQSLIFYLHSATELFCPPGNIISIILQSAEKLNMNLSSLYNIHKNSSTKVDTEMIHGIQRCWILLQRLVMVASGSLDESGSKSIRHGFQFGSLVPFSSWVNQIPTFSVSSFPLVRYFGWKAMFHFANQYLQKQLFIALDLSQLSSLLSIFSDDLALIDTTTNQKVDISKEIVYDVVSYSEECRHPDLNSYQDSFIVFYPDLHEFFPDVKIQFRTFGESILEAIGLRLKSLPTIALPDILCWFSGLCNSPFLERGKEHVNNSSIHWRGRSGRNVKVVILYLLESIVSEHMEAMVPELPRLALVLASLCKASYCDVAFLDSVLHLLKPLISYALSQLCNGKKLFIDPARYDYEALCFEELFNIIRSKNNSQDGSDEIQCQGSLVIFILAALFPDLSLQRKREILQSLQTWANFTTFEQSSSFFDYLCAFQNVVDSCDNLLVQTLESLGIQIPGHKSLSYEKSVSAFSECADQSHQSTTVPENLSSGGSGTSQLVQREFDLPLEDIENIIKYIKDLFSKLYPAVEFCWMLHFQLALKLSSAMAKCYIWMGSLISASHITTVTVDADSECTYQFQMCNSGSRKGKPALQEITSAILTMQENHCWQVASAMLDYLLGLPEIYSLNDIIPEICLAIRNCCCQAPRISWRVKTDHWLSLLSSRDINPLLVHESSVGDLFCTMLEHSEPEQRSIALWHLGRLVDLDVTDGVTKLSCMVLPDPHHDKAIFASSDSAKSKLVSYTWDKVSTLASSDPLMSLRAKSMALLSGYIPFAERRQLQSFFIAADHILPGLGTHLYPMQGPVVRLSLCVLACACLYSPTEDISLIPESMWRKLETMISSKSGTDGFCGLENEVCRVLYDFRTEVDSSKEVLSNILSSISPAKPNDPHFSSIRESILQVLSSMSSIESYFEFFTKRAEQENQELEEAEIEMDLLQKEKSLFETSEESAAAVVPSAPMISYQSESSDRLNKLKIEIRNMERSKLREEIVARRQKKILARHARQKYLEEAALHEMELLQELDRERTAEVGREIERQRLLDVERAKTKEIRHNLEIERERQAQRDLQRELEQAEAGVQVTRKEFSNTSRPRERYRDRDNGRSSHEVSARPSSHVSESNLQPATSGSTSTSSPPTLLLAGSRSFSSQPPTILQSRDKPDDRSTGNDDFYEGNRDSGDGGSVGESENMSSFDGMTGGFGAAARQGSRGSRSRQIVERRERDGKREGKWERKHA